MNLKELLFTAIFSILLGQLYAQTSPAEETHDNVFENQLEIYFKFQPGDCHPHVLTRMISIDKVEDDTIFAYANKREFESFLKLGLKYELLPKPGELLKNPRMLDDVDIRGIDEWDFYPTYNAYLDMMNQFADEYPALCEVFSIGQSTEGRELMMLKISKNVSQREEEPRFLYTGTMHGDETMGYVTLLRLADYLLENYGGPEDVTNLVDNAEIWINPLANPDGTFAGGNNTVNGATRYNANGVDLNRNFPDPEDGPHPDGNEWQEETLAFMQLAEDYTFTMSANTHGGEEVLNYPWDTWPQLAADNQWWVDVCREYADTVHLYAPADYLNGFDNGITNGYQWYSISGGRQDYMNYFHNCREVTMELSDTKLLPAAQLPDHWEWNYRSLINYMEQSLFGVNGIVTDLETGAPLEAKVYIDGHDIDNSFVYAYPENGYYQRLLEPGTYDITYSAPGHYPVTIEGIEVVEYQVNTIDVQLDAGDLIADFAASSTDVSIGTGVDFFDESYGNPVAWEWIFEGGQPATSSDQNPEGIIWSETGSYDVSLTITDSDNNQQTVTKPDFISVNAEFLMSNQTVSTCSGIFYDSGGENGDYQNDENYTMTFMPGNADSKIIVEFEMFNVEYNSTCDYDWLKIYDGPSVSQLSLIGTYCGTDSPGTIEATNIDGALTFEFESDFSVTEPGWKALISCTAPPLLPVADFEADQTQVDMGQIVNFTDLSTNNPTAWAWVFEGGEPASSSEQNPSVIYPEPGIYDVTLIVQNEYGSDTKTVEDYITVDSTIGLIELLEDGLKIYPNPAKGGFIHVESEHPVETAEVYDLSGKLLMKKLPNSPTFRINVGGLQNGTYLIRIFAAGKWKNIPVHVAK